MVIISVILAIAIPVTALYGFGPVDTTFHIGNLWDRLLLLLFFFWPRLS